MPPARDSLKRSVVVGTRQSLDRAEVQALDMGKGRKKGAQSWRAGFSSKAERARSYLKAVSEAQWELQAAHARRRRASAGRGGPNQQQRPPSTRAHGRAQAHFLLQYLSVCAADRVTWGDGRRPPAVQNRGKPPPPQPQDEVDVMRYLDEEELVINERSVSGTAVPSLVDLCCRQIGQDLPLYAGPRDEESDDGDEEEQGEGSRERGEDEEDGEEEDDGRQALLEIMSLLPTSCLESISLAASRHGNVTDDTLPLLCHPHVRRLVLVGSFTDEGLAESLYPAQAVCRRPSFSWEDDDVGGADGEAEPDEAFMNFRGCLELERLVLSSPCLTPAFLTDLAVRVPTIKSLALFGCFDTCFLSQQEILRELRCMRGLLELDLRGCQWLTEKGLIKWLESSEGQALPTLARLRCGPAVATPAAQVTLRRLRHLLDLVPE